MTWENLPTINAILNSASAILLAAGYLFIRAKNVNGHRWMMVTAFCTSTLFLVGYLLNHAHAGIIHYQGQGAMRTVYFTILTTHTILAVVIVPMILRTLFLAIKGRFHDHLRLARWTLPLWFYVSVTGVVIYEMLY